jgi:hypothetical protein
MTALEISQSIPNQASNVEGVQFHQTSTLMHNVYWSDSAHGVMAVRDFAASRK